MSIKKNIALLMGGTALAQIFTFAISPLLARLYNPDDFGVLGIVLSASSIIAVIAHLRLNLAINYAKNMGEAYVILITAAILCIPIVFLATGILSCFVYLFNISGYSLIIYFFIIILAILNAYIDLLTFWNSYLNNHKISAKNSVVRSFLTGVCQLSFYKFSGLSLILGVIFGSLISFISFLKDRLIFKELRFLHLKEIKNTIFKYKDLPLYSMPQGFLASLSLNSAPILLASNFSVAIAGQYWLAYRLLIAPISIVGTTYRQVVMPIFVKNDFSYNKKIVFKHTTYLLLTIIPIMVILFYVFPLIFNIGFGEKWKVAGYFASWLVLGFGFDIIKVPVFCFLQAYNKHKFLLVYEVILGFFRFFALFIGSMFLNYIDVISVFSVVNMIFSSILIVFCLFYKNMSSN